MKPISCSLYYGVHSGSEGWRRWKTPSPNGCCGSGGSTSILIPWTPFYATAYGWVRHLLFILSPSSFFPNRISFYQQPLLIPAPSPYPISPTPAASRTRSRLNYPNDFVSKPPKNPIPSSLSSELTVSPPPRSNASYPKPPIWCYAIPPKGFSPNSNS